MNKRMKLVIKLLSIACCLPALTLAGPLKVFILAGQSNMEGHGEVSPAGTPGTLENLFSSNPTAYAHLKEGNNWAVRDDVWIHYKRGGTTLLNGGLSAGYGAYDHTIGPELQFGHVIGDYYDEPVLLIKTAWGGKSLAIDYRPPSSGDINRQITYDPPKTAEEQGFYYREMMREINDFKADPQSFYPAYNAAEGYEIVGFGWHQGWNDRVDQAHNDQYEQNMENFIKDVRSDLGIPNLPFVIATTGMQGWEDTHPRALSLMEAQLAMANETTYPDFKGNVAVDDTRDYYRDASASPSSQGYHWNRNAATYYDIGDGMGQKMLGLLAAGPLPPVESLSIDTVYFAQTHVMKPTDDYFGLVGNRDVLVKAHVVAPGGVAAPSVTATLRLNGQTQNLSLSGPAMLPESIPDGPGVVQHTFADSFTALIPAAWVKKGLEVTVKAGSQSASYTNLKIGAPTKVFMTMFDVNYFKSSPGDYPAGWKEELEAKWPVSELIVRRVPNIVFPELVIPPREGKPAVRVSSQQDYLDQTGINFDGEQAAALSWNGALKRAGATHRYLLSFVNIYGVNAGGQAGGFSGVGNGTSEGVLSHELGHALSLPHWRENTDYPYQGPMYGIPSLGGNVDVHVGPTWGFDLPTQTFIPPTIQPNNPRNETVGAYKRDPMQGGGVGYQEKPFLLNHFSDYSENQMRNYLERHVVIWNEELGQYASWDSATGDYTSTVLNNGLQYPVERDVQVISVMASISGSNPDVNMVYPPIGPYSGGLIKRFDPRVAADRTEARAIFAPSGGCDLSLRIIQGGVEKVYMLPASWDTNADPLSGNSLKTEAVNLPAADGTVTRAELLLTPDAEVNGLPTNPHVLYTWASVLPDQAAFKQAPTAVDASSISMQANDDLVGGNKVIEYLFTETSGNVGGSSSGWQSSPYFIDSGLLPSTEYSYTVTMRLGSQASRPSEPVTVRTKAAMATKNSISVNFYAYGPIDSADYHLLTLENDEYAGIPSSYVNQWQNIPVPWGLNRAQPPATISGTGGATATFVLNDTRNGGRHLPATPREGLSPTNGNGDLMDSHANGTADPGDGSNLFEMTVSDISFSKYSLIVYLGSQPAQFGDGAANIVLNNGAEQHFTLTAGAFQEFIPIVNSQTSGNYIVFEGLTDQSLNLKVWGNGFNHIGPCGFQLIELAEASSYAQWATENGVGSALGDDDGDGRNNLYEYALGGNPKSSTDAVDPTLSISGTNVEYRHKKRNDDPNLNYRVEACTNLLSGEWVDLGTVPQTGSTEGSYNEVIHRVPTAGAQSYIRLIISALE